MSRGEEFFIEFLLQLEKVRCRSPSARMKPIFAPAPCLSASVVGVCLSDGFPIARDHRNCPAYPACRGAKPWTCPGEAVDHPILCPLTLPPGSSQFIPT